MSDFQDNLAARQLSAFFSATRGYSQPATVTSGGTAQVCQVIWKASTEHTIRENGEVSQSNGTAQIPKADCTLTQSRAGDWGTLTITIDGTSNTFRITEKRKESPAVYVVACALSTSTQLGRTT